jgi:hypothetical protein
MFIAYYWLAYFYGFTNIEEQTNSTPRKVKIPLYGKTLVDEVLSL